MQRADLAERLLSATASEQKLILELKSQFADEKLARELRVAALDAWSTDPDKVRRAAAALKLIYRVKNEPEIDATAAWINGISEITKSRFESAVSSLDKASRVFAEIGWNNEAAQPQVAKLVALAMLGRYSEAVESGLAALRVFSREGDELAAGKIEMNISNIMSRQSRHAEAKRYIISARQRFKRIGEKRWRTMAENDLAITFVQLNEYKKAETYFRQALSNAKAEKMSATEAETEASLGNLALFRGRYSEALRFLESSRQKYEELGVFHSSAVADLEIADIYAELNLLAEAAEIYRRVSSVFRKLRLRGEEARARLNYGQTARKLGDFKAATRELKKALILFGRENDQAGRSAVLLEQAAIANSRQKFSVAARILEEAASLVKEYGNARHLIKLNFSEGEAYKGLGETAEAERHFSKAAEIARKHEQIDLLWPAFNELGQLASARGDDTSAEKYFSKAVHVIEELRSPFASDDFSLSFLISRLEPFENLARLQLKAGKIAAAFNTVERGRSRSMLDQSGGLEDNSRAAAKLRDQAAEVRSQLNFFYKELDKKHGDGSGRLTENIARAETQLTNLARQLNSLSVGRHAGAREKAASGSFKEIQKLLGKSRTLIEYVEWNGRISAFVVDEKAIRFVPDLATSHEVNKALGDLHFQFGSVRYAADLPAAFANQIKQRTDKILHRLHAFLLGSISDDISCEKLVIAVAGSLHYVPFHALHDGSRYAIERYEINHTPSAAVWARLRKRQSKKIRNAFLVGYADEHIPHVEDEIRDIRQILPDAKSLCGEDATFASFVENAPNYDLIHMACHGQFRPDNAMFSSLHLADGWVTVQDICLQRLKARLVTLSACETGLNKVVAGNEIMGMARGFLRASAQSLVVSLWRVNDEAARRTMKRFYIRLQRGNSVAASLRGSILESVKNGEHPFYWAPFILIGR